MSISSILVMFFIIPLMPNSSIKDQEAWPELFKIDQQGYIFVNFHVCKEYVLTFQSENGHDLFTCGDTN